MCSNSCAEGKKRSHNYQTGAAEYAEIQTACFCQFNYSLEIKKGKQITFYEGAGLFLSSQPG